MRANTAIVFAWAIFLAAFATGCSYGNTEASAGSDKDQARLEIKGSPGIEFYGSCTIGDGQPTKIGGEVPKSFIYHLEGRSLDCEISSDRTVICGSNWPSVRVPTPYRASAEAP